MGYTEEEIRSARALIKKIMSEEILYKKGGVNFSSLNGNDIETLFDLYDITFFRGQIREKIIESDSFIEFFARSRKSGVGGLCGVKYIDKRPTYYMDIAPNIVDTIFRTYRHMITAAGFGCYDRLSCTQLIMEHELIHLLMLLWGFGPKDHPTEIGSLSDHPKEFGSLSDHPKEFGSLSDLREDKIYGHHGLLFQCMLKEYFGHTRFDHDLGLSGISISFDDKSKKNIPYTFLKFRQEKNSLIGAGFENWSASCYLDSILVVLLDSISSFWRMGIMDVDVNAIDYTGNIPGEDVSEINTLDKMRTYAKKVQDQIKEDYTSTHKEQKTVKCTVLRWLLAQILPSMRPSGRWVLFNAGAAYDAIVNVFPDLLLDIPYQIHRWDSDEGKYMIDSVDYSREASLTMWDYLDPLIDTEENHDYKEIRWDLIDSPVLVFYNGGTPRIRDFGTSGIEKGYILIRGDNTGIVNKYEFDIFKARSFGMTIIDDRYLLVGVITLEGVTPKNEGGSHYTAYFLGVDNNWYYYNDIGAQITKIEKLPQGGVWTEQGSRMPSMYFYQRIKRPNEKIQKKPANAEVDKRYRTSPKDIKFYEGVSLNYKKIRAGSDPNDIAYMYYVYDKTRGHSLPLSAIGKKFGVVTDVESGVKMWKINEKDQIEFEEKLKIIDSKQQTLAETNRLKKSQEGIDSVDVGEIFEIVPIKNGEEPVQIINYTDNTFIVLSSNPLDILNDGLLTKNMRYGYKGYGYIYNKDKFTEIRKRLN